MNYTIVQHDTKPTLFWVIDTATGLPTTRHPLRAGQAQSEKTRREQAAEDSEAVQEKWQAVVTARTNLDLAIGELICTGGSSSAGHRAYTLVDSLVMAIRAHENAANPG